MKYPSSFLHAFKEITLVVVVTKFVGVRGHKVPFRMMNRYALRFLGGTRRGDAFLDHPSERKPVVKRARRKHGATHKLSVHKLSQFAVDKSLVVKTDIR